MEIGVGSIVYSKKGRDKTRILLVIKLDGEYAYVADGDLRKVEALKKKKLKHLQGTLEKVFINDDITNSDVRKILDEYKNR